MDSAAAPAPEAEPSVMTELQVRTRASLGQLPLSGFDFLVRNASPKAESAGMEWLAATRQKLRIALKNYGFDAEVIGERLTPNAALIRFKGSDRLTVADVEKKQGVLLTSHSLPVIAVHPAPGEVIVMVARPERAFPDLADVWLRRRFGADVASGLLGGRSISQSWRRRAFVENVHRKLYCRQSLKRTASRCAAQATPSQPPR